VLLLLSELGLFVADERMLNLVMLVKRQVTITSVVASSASINNKVFALTSPDVSSGAVLE